MQKSNAKPTFLSPPPKDAKGHLGTTFQFHERKLSSAPPNLSLVYNKFTRGNIGNLGEKNPQFFNVLSRHCRVFNISDPPILNAASASKTCDN